MWDIVKASRRIPAVRPRDRRRLPKAFGRRSARLAVPAPPRHALLAENLWPKTWGKPSLWVNIKDLWYKSVVGLEPDSASRNAGQ